MEKLYKLSEVTPMDFLKFLELGYDVVVDGEYVRVKTR